VAYLDRVEPLKIMRRYVVTVFLVLLISGCGGIRYSEIAPEAKDFHPRNIGVLPVDVGPCEDARGVIDLVVSDVLTDKGWFTGVVAADTMKKQILSSEDAGKVTLDYISKLKTVNYSDPALSKRIGELFNIDAFLVVDLLYWNYTKIEDNKVAKVEAGIEMINANTGQILWKAHHFEVEEYRFMKPQLSDVARSLMKKMTREMPH